jgi:hypothetical protein
MEGVTKHPGTALGLVQQGQSGAPSTVGVARLRRPSTIGAMEYIVVNSLIYCACEDAAGDCTWLSIHSLEYGSMHTNGTDAKPIMLSYDYIAKF